jgi:hypothetical protein
MAVWQVEIDGEIYELEGGNVAPTEQEARSTVGQFKQRILPEKITQSPDVQLMAHWLRNIPFGQRMASVVSGQPLRNIQQTLSSIPEPQARTFGMALGKALPDIAMATPVMRGAGLLGQIPRVGKFIPPIAKTTAGLSAYSGIKAKAQRQPVAPAIIGGVGQGLLFGGLSKLGATTIPSRIPFAERLGSALGGATAGAIIGGTPEETAFFGALGAIFPNQKMTVSKLRDYAGNKVNLTRQGAKQYWRREVNAYGNSINLLTTDRQPITLDPLMQKMTQQMIERRLYDPINQQWLKPLNKVDAQLYKSYESLSRWFTSKGNAPTGEIIKEWRNIRDSAPIDTPLGREGHNLANEMLGSIKDQIKSDIFQQANIRYADFRNKFDLVDKYVDVWGSPLETAKGERFLMEGRLGATKETRETGRIIEKELGQKLKRAKIESSIRRLPILRKWL